MTSLTTVSRAHVRAAGAWAAVTGLLLAFRVGGDVTLVGEFLAAGYAALVAAGLGVLGNAWLASHILSFSTMLSEKGIPAGLSRLVLVAWQVMTAGMVAGQFAPALPVLRYAAIPYFPAILGAVVFIIEARIMLKHMTKPTPVHWAHFVAAGALAISALLLSLAPSGPVAARILYPLFGFGWAGAATVTLFAAGVSLEPYEDMRAVWVSLAGLAAMLLGAAAGQAGIFVFLLGLIAFVLSFAYLLAGRWQGHFDSWSERLLMAGVVAYFFAATGPEEILALPAAIFLVLPGDAVAIRPALIPGVLLPALAWAGAALLVYSNRIVLDRAGRAMLWAGCAGMTLPWVAGRILFMSAANRYESFFFRGLFIAGTVGAAIGFLTLAQQVRPGAGRRRRKLKVVE